METIKNRTPSFFQLLLLVSFFVTITFIVQGHIQFNLRDESFLWYGVQQVMQGEVPILDFMAYDPGRYYWSAAWMSLWNDDGIIPLRISCAILQILGLWVGIRLISQSTQGKSFFYLVISLITLMSWMFVYYKQCDYSMSIFLIGILTFLIQNPSSRNYFLAGVCVGLIAFFGRNHGLYGAIASVGAIAWLNIKRTGGPRLMKGLLLWTLGVALGFLPILLMALLIPGFAHAFWESIRFLFEIKGTNLNLDVPWPWKAHTLQPIFFGLFFVALLIFGIFSLIWSFRQKILNKAVAPSFVAASLLTLPYAHYAFSRADIHHLSFGIFPLLIGCLVFSASRTALFKWITVVFLCIISLYLMRDHQPVWQCHINKCVYTEISGSKILVAKNTANDIKILKELTETYAPQGQSFIVSLLPAAYTLAHKASPTWEIYALFSRPAPFEKAEIERIKKAKPGYALIFDQALDGKENLRYKNTHPLTYQYITENFEKVMGIPNPNYEVFKEKEIIS